MRLLRRSWITPRFCRPQRSKKFALFTITLYSIDLENNMMKTISRKALSASFIIASALASTAIQLQAQDDVTTQNAASAYDGGYITGPASNPLSFLNGPAYRTFD